MSDLAYTASVTHAGKPLAWLAGEIKSPPFSAAARQEAGYLLRLLQLGESLSLPHSRPLPVLGARCHELRIRDAGMTWRIIYRVDPDAVLILEVFNKTTRTLPRGVIANCTRRQKRYDDACS